MSVQLFYSKPARMMMYLAIPVVLMTQYTQFNTTSILIQALTYMGIAYNAECLVEGGCDMWAWSSVLLPIIYSLLFIFFGGQLGLIAIPPSPLTNILPVKRVDTSTPATQQSESATTVIYTDNIDSILAANSTTTEPFGGSPTTTTGHVHGALSF